MKMNTYWVIPFLLAVLAGCSRSEADIARGEFLAGCVTNSDKATCACVYDELKDVYSEKVLIQFGKTRPIPDDFIRRSFESALKCKKK